ncbi:sialate O-acetylesterase [Pedobacter sp. MC2016-14]|uniref:sialate O-acetylesterase n=1 Tax=Pedobacter sp. MC2016-14 TaxID=2897327 RepID=UPI001E416DC5|nr:sialate O-acetylesterase [Pedobacter sp. MC2016-14]MCD0489384.1 sialate O-acetylesterase [Pedobacter sp. MC2016-14]
MKPFRRALLTSVIATLLLNFQFATVLAEVKPAAIFTDHMVLQQNSNVAIWGWAKANTAIKLVTSWNNKKYAVKSDEAGKWKLKVSTPAAGGPYEISISDGEVLKLKDILIGEVWFCGGQSNMEMPMKGFKGQPIIGSNEDVLKSSNDKIRLYTVPRSSITARQENSKSSVWKAAGPESVVNFSATAYYFGQLLTELLHVPVGLINDSYGGSSIEAWMSPEALKKYPEIKIPAKADTIKEVSRTPTTLYNGMLYPVVGYGIKGAIWYQGESNYERPFQYESLFPDLVSEWRAHWGLGDFPFYFAQIAPYNYKQLPAAADKLNAAFLRDAQRKSVARISNSGMAVLMDVGEENCIHPSNKKQGGHRLAYQALALTYGIKGFGYTSPEFDTLTIDGSTAIVKFKMAANGMTSFGKTLKLFELAGADKKFYPASAKLSGSSVTLTCDQVKNPVAVRYAFKDFVVGDLFSNEGLPVSSFRTDNWEN